MSNKYHTIVNYLLFEDDLDPDNIQKILQPDNDPDPKYDADLELPTVKLKKYLLKSKYPVYTYNLLETLFYDHAHSENSTAVRIAPNTIILKDDANKRYMLLFHETYIVTAYEANSKIVFNLDKYITNTTFSRLELIGSSAGGWKLYRNQRKAWWYNTETGIGYIRSKYRIPFTNYDYVDNTGFLHAYAPIIIKRRGDIPPST